MNTLTRHLDRLAPTSSCVLLTILLASTLTVVCAATPRSGLAPVAPAGKPPASAALLEQIRAEIGDAPCDSDAQCHSLSVGAKACGGPDNYLPWSSKYSSVARLKFLGEQHAAARREENSREGRMSNCMYLMDPGAACQTGRCKPGTGDLPR